MTTSAQTNARPYSLFGPELRAFVLVALAIRFVLMPISGHFDMVSEYGKAARLLTGSLRWEEVLADHASCLFHAVFLKAEQPFLKTFFISAGTTTNDESSFGFWQAYTKTPEVFLGFSLMKLPYLAFDLLCAWLLLVILGARPGAPRAVKLWFFSPIAIYVTYMFGRFDVIAAAFLLLSILSVKKGKSEFAGLLFGIAVALRFYYLLFIPAYAMVSSVTWRERLKLGLFATVPILLQVAAVTAGVFPIAFPSAILILLCLLYFDALRRYGWLVLCLSFVAVLGLVYFRSQSLSLALDHSGFGMIKYPLHGTFPFMAKINLWGYDTIFPVFVLYGLFLFGAATVKSWRLNSFAALFSVFLLLFYSFSFFHPQYLVVLVAALSLSAVWEKKVVVFHVLQSLLVFVILFNWGAHPTNYIFAPLAPDALFSSKALTSWLQQRLGDQAPMALIGGAKSLFTATCLWMSWLLVKFIRRAETDGSQAA